jgi:NAD(P)H-flavin reductase/ferredoxin
MSRLLTISVQNGGSFHARPGETLLDAALMNGVDMPHDCRSGHCGTCRCDIVSGNVLGGETESPSSVLACQARLMSNVEVVVEEVPEIETFKGQVRSLEYLAQDVIEATIETSRPIPYLPGQYCQFRFSGFPSRCYSPTVPITGPLDRNAIRLHIRQIPNGRISSALGNRIRVGHNVKIDGPFGSAYLRAGKANPLILVASGTGFAPIWSIAHSALCEMPDREIVAIVGAKTLNSLYMTAALNRLIAFPRVQVIPVISYGEQHSDLVRIGSPVDYLPPLNNEDIVYACGGPGMVEAAAHVARQAGAKCYSDPFAPAQTESESFAWARRLLASASGTSREKPNSQSRRAKAFVEHNGKLRPRSALSP